jgi:hypothetical protein
LRKQRFSLILDVIFNQKQTMDSHLELHQIDLDTRVKCSDKQMAADLCGELAILNLQTNVYYGLNAVGARIWSLVGEGRTVREVRDTMLAEYAVDAAQCERDLLRLLTELAQHKLIEICHAPDCKV